MIYPACCQKEVCRACYRENESIIKKKNEKNAEKEKEAIPHTCPFCRELEPKDKEEEINQLESDLSQNSPKASMVLAEIYEGEHATSMNKLKTLFYFIRGTEIGSAEACAGIAAFYGDNFLPRPAKEEYLFLRMGALRGDIVARHNIGQVEYDKGNYELSVRHWKIAAEAGSQPSLNELRSIFTGKMSGREFLSKEYMDKVYRLCYAAQVAVWSEERAKHYDENMRVWKC